jgi:hypothetical protein
MRPAQDAVLTDTNMQALTDSAITKAGDLGSPDGDAETSFGTLLGVSL